VRICVVGPGRIGGNLARCFIADVAAKALVGTLLADLDVDAVDVGPLASGRYIEPAMMMLMRIQFAPGASGQYAFRLLHRETPAAATRRQG